MPATGPSLEPSRDAVKQPKLGHKDQAGRRPFARFFGSDMPLRRFSLDGWELGVMTVGLVLAAALLAVPRAARPGIFPVPLVDVAESRATRERLASLADRAESEGLPFETRAVGDGVRRLGTALSGGSGDADHLRRLIDERVRAALLANQADALLRLRAVQARLFVRAVRAQVWGAPTSPELAALGGDFAVRAQRNGWVTDGGCVATDDELQTLFARRWTELTGLRDDARFKPTLGELRQYFRFLLLYPERSGHSDAPSRERASMRLRYVEALARHDTEYPLHLARGSLLGELGSMPESARALNKHLAQTSSREWNLRARNYLLFAAHGRADEASELAPPSPEHEP
jgi:hypothetical protein